MSIENSIAGAFLKASVDGLNSSGKSQLCVRLAIGISKTYCDSAPVLVADAEERWRAYKKFQFDIEGVPLIRMPGDTLVGVEQALEEAIRQNVCVLVIDQLTTPWKEALAEFGHEDGYLPFDRRQQLMNRWAGFVRGFRYGKFHAICAGRMGYVWENLEDDRGRMRLTQGDSKFNAGGSENFGYEADLELEMHRNKRRLAGLFRSRTAEEYICHVVKDALVGIINGKEFVFPGQVGMYKAGDYRAVFESFRPYLETIRTLDHPEPSRDSSRQLLISGKTAWAEDQSERRRLLEEIDGLMTYCFGSAQSAQGKMFRNLTLEHWRDSWSWSDMEERESTERLRWYRDVMKAVRRRADNKELPTNPATLAVLLELSEEDVHLGPMAVSADRPTLHEAIGAKQCEAVAERKRSSMSAD